MDLVCCCPEDGFCLLGSWHHCSDHGFHSEDNLGSKGSHSSAAARLLVRVHCCVQHMQHLVE